MNTHTQSAIRYILYARKSLESEDRQEQSIDDQISRLTELALTRGLQIVSTLTESKSAKTPGVRPEFARMIKMITERKADGILCWQVNRLARNPVDAGQISWMLQQGIIRSIVAVDRTFLPSDNVLLFTLESGMANQYVRELSQNVRRGMRGRLERGGWPHRAPAGYKNDRNTKTVVPDRPTFTLIRRAWDDVLTGLYTVSEVVRRLNASGYRSRKTNQNAGGAPMSIHGMFGILKNPIYAGIVRGGGEEFKGTHKSMVSIAEFERVQELLAPKSDRVPQSHAFLFSKLLTCGECGCAITAETKTKVLKSGRKLTFTYYHCTRKRREVSCSQRRYLREELLVEDVAHLLDQYAIPDSFLEIAFEVIESMIPEIIEDHATVIEGHADSGEELDRQLARLNRMFLTEMISEEEHRKNRAELLSRIARAKLLGEQEAEAGAKIATLREQLRAFVDVGERFRVASFDQKRRILGALGSNLRLIDRKPTLDAPIWLQRLLELPSADRPPKTNDRTHVRASGHAKNTLSGVANSLGAPNPKKSAPFGVLPRVASMFSSIEAPRLRPRSNEAI